MYRCESGINIFAGRVCTWNCAYSLLQTNCSKTTSILLHFLIGLLACLSYSSPQLMGLFVNKQNNNNDDLMYSRWRSRRLRKVRSRPRQILLESVVRYRSCPQFSIRILFISTKVRPNIIHNYEGKTEYYSYLRR